MTTPQQQFIVDIYPGAKKIAEQTGSSLELVLAQTALETGWGQHVLEGTHNLYNIKADASWKGKTAEFTVPEVDDNGKTYMSKEKFRVYDSYAESMADRAKFLADNPRYAKSGLYDPGVKGNLEKEAETLQKAHYATDKTYAAKLIETGHGPTLRAGIDIAEGRLPQVHEKHAGTLRKGDRGDAVGSLQTSLAELGYKDANGHPVKEDKDFGAATDHAVKAFQHDHGLREDGVVGKATGAAISEAAAHAHAQKAAPSMADVGHPANGMYNQAFQCVAQIDKEHNREVGPHTQTLSGGLVSAATAAGFSRIDNVVLSNDASRAYAVQGALDSPFKQYADVHVMQAIQTPLSQSSAEAVANMQSSERADTQLSQQQAMHSQDTQQQAAPLQR
jgi:peptidoglycan hydrolase-like protein with peptidoglycan-binding domain